MNGLQTLIEELDKEINRLNEYILSGSVRDYETYRSIVSQVRGVTYAKDVAQKFIDNEEENDR